MAGFQTAINLQPAPAQAGDFASADPRSSVIAGPGQLVSGAGGLTIGRFAWLDATATMATNAGTGVPDGFVHRGSNMAVITTYLAETSNVVPAGYGVTLHDGGVFWAQSLTVATRGQKVFASNTDGTVKTGAAGATVTGYSETRWFVHSAGAANELIKISDRHLGVSS